MAAASVLLKVIGVIGAIPQVVALVAPVMVVFIPLLDGQIANCRTRSVQAGIPLPRVGTRKNPIS